MKLKNQVTVVTGATSGIGRSIAVKFALEGAKVVLIGRNDERGGEVAEEIKQIQGECVYIRTDVTREEDVKAAVMQVIADFGQIDILVNSAGAVLPGSVVDIGLDGWNFVYNTNATSTYLMCHYVLPHMIEKKSGSIINISSESGLKGFKDRAVYCAAKAAVVGLTKAMAVDHSPLGIRVNCICPGTVETQMVKNLIDSNPDPEGLRQGFISRRLLPFLGTPEEIAGCALYLASPESRYMTGSIISIDGGSTAK